MAGRRGNRWLYILVGVLGAVFAVTACAYAVIAFRSMETTEAYLAEPDGGVMRLIRERGAEILGVEIAVLAVAVIAAMATDRTGK